MSNGGWTTKNSRSSAPHSTRSLIGRIGKLRSALIEQKDFPITKAAVEFFTATELKITGTVGRLTIVGQGETEPHGPNSEVFYVSAVDGKRYVMLLGPYETHAEALANVDRGRDLAWEVDPRAPWYGYGTAGSLRTEKFKVKFASKEVPVAAFGLPCEECGGLPCREGCKVKSDNA